MNRILSVNNSEGEDRSIVLELPFQGTMCFISTFFLNKIVRFYMNTKNCCTIQGVGK